MQRMILDWILEDKRTVMKDIIETVNKTECGRCSDRVYCISVNFSTIINILDCVRVYLGSQQMILKYLAIRNPRSAPYF